MKTTVLYLSIGILVTMYIMKSITIDQLFQFEYKLNGTPRHKLICAETLSKGIQIMQIWLNEQRELHPDDRYSFVLDSGKKIGFC
jgi:hypothetical protein